MKMAGRLAAVAAILGLMAGCGGGSGSAMSPEAKTGRLKAGDEAILHNDDGEFVYLGEGAWGFPVDTKVVVVDDAMDEKDANRKVKIKAPVSAIANGRNRPTGSDLEVVTSRAQLRPVVN